MTKVRHILGISKIILPLKAGISNLRYDISISDISDFFIKTEELPLEVYEV